MSSSETNSKVKKTRVSQTRHPIICEMKQEGTKIFLESKYSVQFVNYILVKLLILRKDIILISYHIISFQFVNYILVKILILRKDIILNL